ncbi:MAG: MFS transporter [Gammaproteobacteria bacterium]|nr:MFS transporter [Gammaproteobacteria bacterium]
MRQSGLIHSRRFAPLFLTQFLGAFNDNVFRFALVIFVTFTVAERTGLDTRVLVVLTGAIFILPFFLFSAFAGQVADKYEKAALIRHVKTAEIVVMGLGALGFWLESYPFLLAVLFLMGLQSTFFGPLKYSVLPQHLAPDELTGGNGLIQLGTYVAILTGGLCGGLLASLGHDAPLAIVAAVVGIALLGRTAAAFIPPAPANDPRLQVDRNIARSTWTILAESTRDRPLFVLIVLISMFWFIGATYLSVVPTYGKVLLGADEQAVTLLNAAFTVGIGIGSLACERLSRGRIELGIVPFAALGITLASLDVWLAGTPPAPAGVLTPALFFSSPHALRLFVDLAVIGACGALYIVPLYAALQARSDPQWVSRMLAALNIVDALFMVLSAAFTVALYELGVGVPGVFGVVGLLNLGVLIAATAGMPEFRARARALLGRSAAG